MPIVSTSLRAKLMWSTGLLVLVGLVLQGAISVWGARRSALETLDAQSVALARAHAAGIEQWVDVRHQVVRSFANAIDKPDALAFLQQAEGAGGFDTTYVGYADKRTLFSKPQNLPPDYDPTGRPWYTIAAKAASGVDFVSVGRLTQSAPAADIGLDFTPL